mgnify:CR=1 FL=1
MTPAHPAPTQDFPIASYRLQMRGDMDFAAVEALIPYLRELGISHLYLSPIFTAAPGSTHGYDITDPNQIEPALGGREGFSRLARAAQMAGLAIILDIVPNHLAFVLDNPWLRDVLRHGSDSPYARHFDIDWSGPLYLPMLDATFETKLDGGEVTIASAEDGPVLRVGPLDVPLRPDDTATGYDAATDFAALHDAQHWRLVPWETERDRLAHRRFFNVTSLIGMRVEDAAVFEDMHRLVFELCAAGEVQGLRVDHVDGLADPAAYLDQLAARVGPGIPIWVEKILSGDERIPEGWPVAGTTGYEAGRAIARLLTDADGWDQIRADWQAETGEVAPGGDHAYARQMTELKPWILSQELAAELHQLIGLAEAALRDVPSQDAGPEALREALEALLVEMPRYRTYFTAGDPRAEDVALWQAVTDRAADRLRTDGVLRWLAEHIATGDSDADHALRVRFQQVAGALIAKSHEDTAGFRHTAYLAANEVGAEPDEPVLDAAGFADHCAERLARQPWGLTLTSSHDTKRSEDARMRLVALSHLPDAFSALRADAAAALPTLPRGEVADQDDGAPLAPNRLWYLVQCAIALWQPDRENLPERLAEHMVKALREAKQITTWPYPDEDAEEPVLALARDLMLRWQTSPPEALTRIVARAESLSLCQLALKCLMPGVPDIYRGCEGTAFSLTDPDNRRPIDFAEMARLPQKTGLAGAKSRLLRELLAERRANPRLFETGRCEIRADSDGFTLIRRSESGSLRLTLYPTAPRDLAVVVETAPEHA